MSPKLRRITVYPIKSLASVALSEVAVLPGGALAGDRRFALIDAEGRFVNGKRTAAIHRICAEFNMRKMTVRLGGNEDAAMEFSLIHDQRELGRWFSDALGVVCVFAENAATGFPDDTAAPGPTLISTATLAAVASWFPGLTLDEARRRFRANLEIDEVPPFWEDRLVGPTGSDVPFQIGGVRWLGAAACQRCAVPTRASDTGQATPRFQNTFSARRRESLPPWAPAARFDHFYRLAVNTRLAEGQLPAMLRVGDALRLA